MEIEESDGKKLRIILDGNEMTELFGSYEEIDYNDPYIRSALHSLIDRVCPQTSSLSKQDRLLIEVKPYHDGCMIELSKYCNTYKKRLYPARTWRLDFYDTESMLDAFCFLYKHPSKAKSSSALFYSNGRYHAVINATKATADKLKRYCFAYSSPIAIAELYEHAQTVCASKAVEAIGSAFSIT